MAIQVESITTKFGTAKKRYDGYFAITSRKEGNANKLLHRLIYENFYGWIPKRYVIHHKDGNKENNCIMNLQLMKESEHKSLHLTGKHHPFYGKTGKYAPFYGKKHSDETKGKISEIHKGKIVSEETRKKLSEVSKGRNPSIETKLKLSKLKNTSGYYNVSKRKDKKAKQGFYWAYQYYDENGKRKVLTSNDLDKLRYRVISRGLKWFKFEEGD